MPIDLFLLGAGGHAKVVLASLLARGHRPRIFDEDPHRVGGDLLGFPIELLDQASLPPHGHIAIGDNGARARLWESLAARKISWHTVIDERAAVAPSAVVEDGVFVAAQAVVGPDARVGFAAIVNHGAVVDHDVRVGACCHIAPNATLGGGVCLGKGVLVGSGAIVLPGVEVGDRAVVGAGAVVTRAVPPGTTVLGVPARRRSQ